MQPLLLDLPEVELPPSIGSARVAAMSSGHVLTRGRGITDDYDYTLNPYRGCSFGCSYCFAAAFVADEQLKRDWGNWVEVKTRAADVIRSKRLYDKRIFMSSATDPYQPLEAKVGLTRSIVEELLRVQARLVVQTRSPLCTRDIDLFKQFKHVRVNLSITTDDDETRKRYEPGCPSIERRLDAVQQLVAAGIKTTICLLPMIPVTDPEAFAERINAIGPTHVAAGYFRFSTQEFASTTREPARELAVREGWTREAFDRTWAIMKPLVRRYSGSEGSAPE